MEQRYRQVYGEGFNRARLIALNRNPTCQFCGFHEARQGHHWTWVYPDDGDLSPDHLTALCAHCHEIATAIRKHYKYSSHRDKPVQVLKELEVMLQFCRGGAVLQPIERQVEPVDEEIRRAVLERNPKCQFCGRYRTERAYCWAYGEESCDEGGLDRFTALCEHCDKVAAMMREHYLNGGKPPQNIQGLKRALQSYPRFSQSFEKRKRLKWAARSVQ